MVKFLAGMFAGMLVIRVMQIHAENVIMAAQWDAFVSDTRALADQLRERGDL